MIKLSSKVQQSHEVQNKEKNECYSFEKLQKGQKIIHLKSSTRSKSPREEWIYKLKRLKYS